MNYEFLVSDIKQKLSQKNIGTDKGLAKIGDGLINLAYSVAKSIFLSRNNSKICQNRYLILIFVNKFLLNN